MNELRLRKSIFNSDILEGAISDFSDLCDIQIKNENDYVICSFFNCKYDTIETMKEFENYVIDLLNATWLCS